MVKRARSNRSRKSRVTVGFQPSASCINVSVNATLTSSTYHYYTPNNAISGSTIDFYVKPTSMEFRAASSTPTNLTALIERSSDGTTWEPVWQTNTGIIGENSLLIKLRAPRYLLPAQYYRWGLISSGEPLVAGVARFSILDPF